MTECTLNLPQFVSTELESPITEMGLLLVGRQGNMTKALGSAVFIAPELVMTAKHVVTAFWDEYGNGMPASGQRPLRGHFCLYAVQYPGSNAEAALWHASTIWGSRFTDISFMSVYPVNDLAKQYSWSKSPRLNLLPPPVNERVAGFGYPSSVSKILDSGEIRLELHATTTCGMVTRVYPELRDLGMLRFPCFEINAYFIGGMSGGPLFNEAGEICGLICASQDGQPISYGATLWPAFGTQITHQGPGMISKGPYPVFEMATVGILHATGWEQIAPRVKIETDPFGEQRLRLAQE